MLFRFTLFFCLGIALFSCGKKETSFVVSEVDFLTNVARQNDSLVSLNVDLNEAVLKGIEIPGSSQTASGYFSFSFKIRNTSGVPRRFYYKLFYQNTSYAFPQQHELSGENFYGSWQDSRIIFKSTPELAVGAEVLIKDSFKIVGNPRNEKCFYGASSSQPPVDAKKIDSAMANILKVEEWRKSILEKAKQNNISVEQQLFKDALWSLANERQRDSSSNNRWKRNPRMGLYEFSVVVTTPESFDDIPPYIKDISQTESDNRFINPFSWFANGIEQIENTQVYPANRKLKVNARLDFSKGIYVNPLAFENTAMTRSYYSSACNDSVSLYQSAQMELFFHNINRDYKLHNIPVVADVTGENYSRKDYETNIATYEKSGKLIDTYVNATDCPCRNVQIDKTDSSIVLKNPGNRPGEFRKEHVGVISRIGFTYGKFRAKIKFPKILSRDHVWNGITNAFWLMAQEVNLSWNQRRICNSDVAYIPKQEPDNEASLTKSKKQITYSEIDFEILKESEFWPKSSYNVSNTPYKTDDAYNNQDIMVTCTNWDMACHQPEFFNIGAAEHIIDGGKYIHHRWNQWYKALTTKVKTPHDELFGGSFYYYEVEWSPEKIVWRIGPSKDKMRVICVMDKNVTAVPNNQMLMIITQEWHNQEWWPTAPYKQNFIPFPKNDIVGKVIELEIE